MLYQCPICHQPLILSERTHRCLNKHAFDIAKEGYINLMPAQHKHSKEPGDNQEMMQARRAFLNTGHYHPLREKVGTLLEQYLHPQAKSLLDIGCGEGYYTGFFAEHLQQQRQNEVSVFGLDIAKFAIKSAAKRYSKVNFCVASSYRLPFHNNTIDAIVRIYAPCNAIEMQRVSSNNAILLTVRPAPNHLRQLKALIYPNVKLHSEHHEDIDGFTLQMQFRMSYLMPLRPPQGFNLLQMTPFAWRTSDAVSQALRETPLFECDADFYISVYRRAD